MAQARIEQHHVPTSDGWSLSLWRLRIDAPPRGTPVLFVPGYGMNSYIAQFHPSGRSFLDVLLDAGLDPWGVDLRGTSTSGPGPDAGAVSLEAFALRDLPAAVQYVRQTAGVQQVHAIGCSLGGSMLLAHVALSADSGVDRLVAIGTPLDWGRSRRRRILGRLMQTVGAIPVKGTRPVARVALPVVARLAPAALRFYLNPSITDVGHAVALTRTVEDPHPAINRDIGAWMRRDLRMSGLSVLDELSRFDRPTLLIVGSGDGVVPRPAALSVIRATAGPVSVRLVAHPDGHPVGHADLFVSDIAPSEVFEPVARFLTAA